MGLINIDAEDTFSIEDFEAGRSIQVRVLVPLSQKKEYEKGSSVTVVRDGNEMRGKVVSDPILIDRKRDDGKATLSLIIEKH